MPNINENESNIDLSEDLDINEIMDETELNEKDIDMDNINEDEKELNQDDSISFDDINELDNELNIDDDIEVKDDFKTDTNMDLDSEIELGEIDSSENINLEDLDLQKDLGLEDKLSITNEDKKDLNESDLDFDLSDDEGKPIGESEEEYGVDVKSKPETITSFEIENNTFEEKIFPEQDEETLRSIVDDIEKEIETNEETDKQEAIDSDIEIEDLDTTNGLVVGEVESNELDEAISFDEKSVESSDNSTEDIDIDLSEISQDEIPEETYQETTETEKDIKEDNNMNFSDIDDIPNELDEVISSDENTEELPDIPVDDLDNIDLSEISQDEFTEETSEENTKTENIDKNNLDIDLSDTDITSEEETAETSGAELSEELPDISSEEIDIDLSDLNDLQSDNIENNEDINPDEINIDLSEDEIISEDNEISENNDQIDLSEIDIPSKLESDITDESGNKENDDFETINIEEDELINIEENILPDDFSLPEIDNETTNIELPEGDELSESISSLSDSDAVMNNVNLEDTGSLDEIDLDNIPQPTQIDENTEEDETISLSSDELEKVTANAKTNETDMTQEEELMTEFNEMGLEGQTSDSDLISEGLNNLDTEISLEENTGNDDLYGDLKKEMTDKNDKVQVQSSDLLKQNIKDVLEYLDQLLDALPEEKIKEFAESKIFEKYKKLFDELKIKS